MKKKITSLFLIILSGVTAIVAQNNCACWQQRDTSFHYVPFAYCTSECGNMVAPYYRNDDAGTNAIVLPFHFCFYGISTDTVYINTNGNITLTPAGANYTTYSPDTFPQVSANVPPMVAPFWSDVDLLPGSGGTDVALYKITPHYMIVQWDSVGYYNIHMDKLNSYQCIISDGTDPIIPNGNNVEFCYRQMQWTTGDASGGSNGFGGDPATVGANAGDGINFVQFGLFDNASATYINQYPPGPNYDGVAWLNYKSFVFSTCGSNLPPIVTGVSPCDTFILCIGDTVKLPLAFLSPKINDSTFSALSPPFVTGVSIIYNHPGNTNYDTLLLVGSAANQGYHVVNLYAWDNQIPHDTTFVSFVLEVDSNATGFLSAAKDTICPGDSVWIKAVTNPQNYLWSPGGSTLDSIKVAPATTTTYSCTVFKGKCSYTFTKTIHVLTGGYLTVTKDTVCKGDSTTLTVHDVSTYKWSTGATTISITVAPDSSTTYKVYCTSGGCHGPDTLSLRVYVLPKIVTGISGPDSICQGGTATITASGGIKYLWSTGDTTQSITVSPPAGTFTYTVSISNGLCAHDTTFKLVVDSQPTAGIRVIPSNDSICKGDSALLIGTGGGTYLWTNNGKTSDSIWVKDTSTTTWTLKVTKTRCTANASVKITVVSPKAAGIRLSKDSICQGDSAKMTAYGGNKYKWLPSGPTDSTIWVKNNGTYSVVVTSFCGSDTVKKALTVLPQPTIHFTGNTLICIGHATPWSASGGSSYTWSPSAGLSCNNCPGPNASPTVTTTYTLTVSNSKCSKDTTIKMTVVDPPPAQISIIPTNCLCKGSSATLTASGGGTYMWSTGSNDSVITVSPTRDSTFIVAVDKVCKDTAKITVCVDIPSFAVCCDTTIQLGGSATLSVFDGSSPNSTYLWTPSTGLSCTTCPNPIATPSVTTTYTVTYTDSVNCSVSKLVTVEIACDDFTMPNVFTPNDDGINDDFVPYYYVNNIRYNGIANLASYSIKIYDRWGKLVYSSTDWRAYWNGRINGTDNLVPDGTYYYIIDATCGSNNTYKKKGFVQVLGLK